MNPIRLDDLQELARKAVDPVVYDYIEGGAHDEITLRENRAAWARLALWPHVLVNAERRDLSTRFLNDPVRMPIGIAPTAFHGLVHPEGEVATARAADAQGAVMIVSTLSNAPLEALRSVSRGPLWLQLYLYRDRGLSREMIRRAEQAGFSALVLTVDAPPWGRRERDERNGFRLPAHLTLGNVPGAERLHEAGGGSALPAYMASVILPSLSWADVEWLRAESRLPVLLKGILRSDDTARAVEQGIDGLVVSNHGGRQLDGAAATAEALPEVAQAAAGRVPVFVDGGIRRGTDVVKALALGAAGVFIGRPALYGLASAGTSGVERALELLRDELDLAMGLVGAATLSAITPDLVRRVGG